MTRRAEVWPPRRELRILLGHAAAALLFLSPSYVRPDSVATLAYLRSLVFDRDLLFFDEWAGFGMVVRGFTLFKEVTPLGTLANHWWIGTSILLTPFYLLARIVDLLTGIGAATGGFFGVYAVTLSWAVVLLGSLTWIIADWLLGKLFGMAGMWRTLLLAGLWIGTPLFWNEFRVPLGTHIPGAFCIAILTLLLFRIGSGSENAWDAVAIGLALGMAIATRIQHFVLVPVVLIAAVALRRSVLWYAKLAAGAMLPLLAQAAAWQVIYGTPLGPLTRGANLGGTTWMPFAQINLLPVLVSSYHGLFTWAPVTILSVAGLAVAAAQRDAIFARLLALMFAGEWLANGLFDRYFWGGTSFGPRRFADLAVPLALGLGGLALRWPRAVGLATAVCAAWGAALTAAAMAGRLDLAHDVDPPRLLAAVLSGFNPSVWSAAMLRSVVVDSSLLIPTVTGVALVAAVALAVAIEIRSLRSAVLAGVALVAIAVVAIALSAPNTRERGASEIRKYAINPAVAGRMGPLLDQQKLLNDELAWEVRTGRRARAADTAALLGEVDGAVARSGVFNSP